MQFLRLGLLLDEAFLKIKLKQILFLVLRIQEECISELHEDLLECEGPPDWFEKSNKEVVCE